MSTCPVPGCPNLLPRRGVFCTDHYFAAPRAYTSLIIRTRFEASRCRDEAARQHLLDQADAYVRSTIRIMGWDRAA